MDRKTFGLLGAVAGLATTIGPAQAAINPAPDASPALQASSYADLLAPIPNAAALLKAEDAARAQAAETQLAQYYYPYYYSPYYYNYSPYPYYSYPYYHHHHHHHHNFYYRRRYHHHHHHHHAAFFAVPGAGKTVG